MNVVKTMAATMIANMKEKTGKTLDQWLQIVSKSSAAKHGEIVKLLKSEHGMTHGFANLVAHKSLKSDAVSASETTGGLGDAVEVNTRSQLHLLGVDLEDGLAAGEVRTIHQHLPVETAWTQQGCIEHLGLVGGRQNDHRLVLGGEAIHLGEQLVEGLLPFVVAADNAHGA